jgi:hypothetical protein
MKIIFQTRKEKLIMYTLIFITGFFIGFLFNKPSIVINAEYKYNDVIEFPNGQKYKIIYNLKE